MIEGFIGDWRVRVQLEKDPKEEDRPLCGYCSQDHLKQQALIGLDANLGAIAMLNTILHEPLHLCGDIYGSELKHRQIYMVASVLSQFLISTKLIDPVKFEAHLRMLAADSKDPEFVEEEK